MPGLTNRTRSNAACSINLSVSQSPQKGHGEINADQPATKRGCALVCTSVYGLWTARLHLVGNPTPPGRLTPAFLRFFFETHFFHALPYTTKKERSGALKLLCTPLGPAQVEASVASGWKCRPPVSLTPALCTKKSIPPTVAQVPVDGV